MNIAVITKKICTDVAAFADLQTAELFLEQGAWPEADTVTELPDGYGIGDGYDKGKWKSNPRPEPPPTPEPPEPDPDEITAEEALGILLGAIDEVQSENNTRKS